MDVIFARSCKRRTGTVRCGHLNRCGVDMDSKSACISSATWLRKIPALLGAWQVLLSCLQALDAERMKLASLLEVP